MRKKRRWAQANTNRKLKKQLFGYLLISPCYYCKFVFLVEDLTIEHIQALCLGGSNDPANITLACRPCNHQKGREAWFQRLKYHEQYPSQH
jgi:5-methylcytosine-specific restriction endonuclease McrA